MAFAQGWHAYWWSVPYFCANSSKNKVTERKKNTERYKVDLHLSQSRPGKRKAAWEYSWLWNSCWEIHLRPPSLMGYTAMTLRPWCLGVSSERPSPKECLALSSNLGWCWRGDAASSPVKRTQRERGRERKKEREGKTGRKSGANDMVTWHLILWFISQRLGRDRQAESLGPAWDSKTFLFSREDPNPPSVMRDPQAHHFLGLEGNSGQELGWGRQAQ